ncbi:MAG: hypothetical protein GXO25_06140 [Euryarchaeota archaeon]|nr:hypothetical protein [Euryarchaeota archaeon]
MNKNILFVVAMIIVLIVAAFGGIWTYGSMHPEASAPHKARPVFTYHIVNTRDVDELKEKIGVRVPGKNYNVIIDGHGTGLAPPTEQEYKSMVGHFIYVDSVKNFQSNGSVDLSQSPYFPPVGNQGQQGSCASWTAAYYDNGYHQAYIHNWTDTHLGTNEHHLMSPSWVYNKVNNGSDGGSDLVGPYKLMMSLGDASLATMPYNDNDYTSWGDEAAWREAPIGRIQNYEVTSVKNIDVIKSWLDEGDTLMSFAINANCYNSAFSDGNYIISWQEYQSYQGSPNHGQTIVGYNDSITDDGDVGAFKVVNSWGSSWGDHGFYWITYNAFSHLAWDQVVRIVGDTPNNPHLLAVWNFTKAGARDASVTIGIGTPDSPIATRDMYHYGGSSAFPTFMAMDMSDFQSDFDNGHDNFFLCIGEKNAGSSSSTIGSFKIEYYAGNYDPTGVYTQISNESPDVPKTTPGCVTNVLSVNPLSISLTAPRGGEIYAGGSKLKINWLINSDAYNASQVNVSMYYTDGTSWNFIATVKGNNVPYLWSLPKLNTSTFRIMVNATDPAGHWAVSKSDNFTIDSAPPKLVSVYPKNGASHVPRTQEFLYLNFSEQVNLTSLREALNITPAVNFTLQESNGHVKIILGGELGNSNEGTTPASTYGDYIDAQTFTVSNDINVTYVQIYMLKEGTPPANCKLEIHHIYNSTDPDGALIAMTSVSPDRVSTSFSWVKFRFASPVHLSAGTYALLLNMSGVGNSTNRYRWGVGSDSYSGGAFYQHSSSGWSEFSSYDGSFILHYGLLKNDTVYKVTVGPGVKDLAGNEMGSEQITSFSTGVYVPELSSLLPVLAVLLGVVVLRKKRYFS